jgi:hypothetical protein
MKLDMQKIYIDSRFRTANSKSESDFNVELPRSFNVPDGVVAHIDDIVIPVSWNVIDDRNNKAYVSFSCVGTELKKDFTFVNGNYDGFGFAAMLENFLNEKVKGFTHAGVLIEPVFVCDYDVRTNNLEIKLTDNSARAGLVKELAPFVLVFLTDEYLKTEQGLTTPNTMNNIIRNTEIKFITQATPYKCYIDLFATRNLYLISSALCSYDTVSNFGMDTIIKKIPCTAKYNEMIFQSSGSTLDGLDVSKRTLRFLDFKLVDTSFKTVPLQGNHFSFSIVFVQKR